MAQLQMFDAISSMAQSTSQYLRYLFKNSQEWVLLKHEVDHVQNYLDIHVMRYGDALTYAIELDQAAADVHVPPLVLQPFVENTIRHALTLDEPIHISISAACKPEDREWVIMEVRDNGKGFPAEQLAILQSGQIPEQNGRHIGIRNTVQRLRLKYEGNMTIRFYNDPDTGGACIWLQIPRRIMNTPQETSQNHL
jgi:two-component system sensor histidine kinase YesM